MAPFHREGAAPGLGRRDIRGRGLPVEGKESLPSLGHTSQSPSSLCRGQKALASFQAPRLAPFLPHGRWKGPSRQPLASS